MFPSWVSRVCSRWACMTFSMPYVDAWTNPDSHRALSFSTFLTVLLNRMKPQKVTHHFTSDSSLFNVFSFISCFAFVRKWGALDQYFLLHLFRSQQLEKNILNARLLKWNQCGGTNVQHISNVMILGVWQMHSTFCAFFLKNVYKAVNHHSCKH